MLFKPKYCCSCGEKITRAEWTLLTSRRFCDVCAIENRGWELTVRFGAAVALLLGIYGFGSFFRTSEPVQNTVRQIEPRLEKAVALKPAPERRETSADAVPPELVNIPSGPSEPNRSKEQRPRIPSASDDAVYHCGAMTKKGTPCSRRVKTPGRCWQHEGKPVAAVPQRESEIY
jgi:hypothetical protein